MGKAKQEVVKIADKIELDDELLDRISGETAQEIAELKEAILANPKLAGEWESCAGLAAKYGKPTDAAIIHYIFYFNFDYGDKLSNDSPNYYGMADNHQEMLQEIRNFGK